MSLLFPKENEDLRARDAAAFPLQGHRPAAIPGFTQEPLPQPSREQRRLCCGDSEHRAFRPLTWEGAEGSYTKVPNS